MKVVKLIAGILGILAALIAIYVFFISPAYISSLYPIAAVVLLLLGSLMMLVSNKKIFAILGTGAFLLSFISFFNHISSVSASELEAGVKDIPNYIPDSIEMIGTALILIVTILSIVALFGKYEKKRSLETS